MLKITVVTPSYNQAEFLEATIQSVLGQNDPNLEYIIMDGGSTDGSVDIIRKYEKQLAYWRSEKDGGQTNAIKDGFARATGDILCWLNSDDMYMPDVLRRVRAEFEEHKETQLLYGDYIVLRPDGSEIAKPRIDFDYNICLHCFMMIQQPSSFWRASLYNEVGGLNTDFQYAFDYDFYLRVGKHLLGQEGTIRHVRQFWSLFRMHDTSKSVSQSFSFKPEIKRVKAQYGVSRYRPLRRARGHYESLRTLWHYYKECGFVPLRKEPGKA